MDTVGMIVITIASFLTGTMFGVLLVALRGSKQRAREEECLEEEIDYLVNKYGKG